jgi:hypothetical protein
MYSYLMTGLEAISPALEARHRLPAGSYNWNRVDLEWNYSITRKVDSGMIIHGQNRPWTPAAMLG